MFPPPPAPIVCNSCTNHFMLWSMPALVLGWGDVHLVDGWGEEHLVVGGELYKGFGFFVPPAKIYKINQLIKMFCKISKIHPKDKILSKLLFKRLLKNNTQ